MRHSLLRLDFLKGSTDLRRGRRILSDGLDGAARGFGDESEGKCQFELLDELLGAERALMAGGLAAVGQRRWNCSVSSQAGSGASPRCAAAEDQR